MRPSLIFAPLVAASLLVLTACEKSVDPKPALRAVAVLLFSAEDVPSGGYDVAFATQSNSIVLTQKENFIEGTEQLVITQKTPCLYEVSGRRGVFHKFYNVKYSFDFSRMHPGEARTRMISIPGFGPGSTLSVRQFVLPGVAVCTESARVDEYDFPQSGCGDRLQRQMVAGDESGRLLNAAKELANFCKVQPF